MNTENVVTEDQIELEAAENSGEISAFHDYVIRQRLTHGVGYLYFREEELDGEKLKVLYSPNLNKISFRPEDKSKTINYLDELRSVVDTWDHVPEGTFFSEILYDNSESETGRSLAKVLVEDTPYFRDIALSYFRQQEINNE